MNDIPLNGIPVEITILISFYLNIYRVLPNGSNQTFIFGSICTGKHLIDIDIELSQEVIWIEYIISYMYFGRVVYFTTYFILISGTRSSFYCFCVVMSDQTVNGITQVEIDPEKRVLQILISFLPKKYWRKSGMYSPFLFYFFFLVDKIW